MNQNNQNVCKAFKAMRDRCIGCMGVSDKAEISAQLFQSTDDCERFVQEHCMKRGAGCAYSRAMAPCEEAKG